MGKKIKLLMAFNAIMQDTLDKQLLQKELVSYLDLIAPQLNLYDLDDWELVLCVSFSFTDKIGAGKRSTRYLTVKEFEVVVSIPLPDREKIFFGINKKSDLYSNPTNDKYFHTLDPCYNEYNDLFDYVISSSKKAISLLFTKGVICQGKKIILQS